VIIGSSNLTSSGLKSNLEASIQLDFRTKSDKQGINLINEIKDYYSDLLDLSSLKLELLTQELLQKLIKDNLLFNQFEEKGKIKESKNNDGENLNEKQTDLEITDFDIEDGFEQKHTTTTNRDNWKSFGKNDNEKFDTLIERYIVYKRTERPSGMVSKHTDDRELFYWYQKMHALYNQGAKSLPFEIFERLLEADFPFDGIGRERKRLNKWNQDFKKIVDYKNKVDPKSEYTYVPQFKDKTNKYYKIGRWFLWDTSSVGSRPKDDIWSDSLVELENYYNKKKNYKSVPSQTTYIGHWLSDQMSMKTKQDREGITDLISPIRIELLGDLLAKNGVEWEWRKQKEREGIESKLESWRIVETLKKEGKTKEFREKNPKLLRKYRDDVAQLKSHIKRWNNERNEWKYELLDIAEFPYIKQ